MSSKYHRFLLSACLPLIAVATISYAPAYAGFEWTPPEETITSLPFEEAEVEVEIMPNPVAEIVLEEENKVELEAVAEIENVLIPTIDATVEEPKDFSLNPFPVEVAGGNEDIDSDIVVLSFDDKKPEEVDPVEPVEEFKTLNIIEGFGSEMPLVLVLRQIVPAKYAFSFGTDINPGETLSWQGGKPWMDVLEEALATIGITYNVDGNKIHLNKIPDDKQANLNVINDDIVKKKLL